MSTVANRLAGNGSTGAGPDAVSASFLQAGNTIVIETKKAMINWGLVMVGVLGEVSDLRLFNRFSMLCQVSGVQFLMEILIRNL
jgi:hypothetical protein